MLYYNGFHLSDLTVNWAVSTVYWLHGITGRTVLLDAQYFVHSKYMPKPIKTAFLSLN